MGSDTVWKVGPGLGSRASVGLSRDISWGLQRPLFA